VHLGTDESRVPLYDRSSLGAGDTIKGPAIISQLDATTLVAPGWTGEVHPSGAILLTR
jgi:N-methylhydantoinase A